MNYDNFTSQIKTYLENLDVDKVFKVLVMKESTNIEHTVLLVRNLRNKMADNIAIIADARNLPTKMFLMATGLSNTHVVYFKDDYVTLHPDVGFEGLKRMITSETRIGDCPICMEPILTGIYCNKCGNHFCKKCAGKHYQNDPKCPFCRN